MLGDAAGLVHSIYLLVHDFSIPRGHRNSWQYTGALVHNGTRCAPHREEGTAVEVEAVQPGVLHLNNTVGIQNMGYNRNIFASDMARPTTFS